MTAILTIEKFQEIIQDNEDLLQWYEALSTNLPDYKIDTLPRIAAFIAQCSHESADFKFIRENLNYRWSSLMRVFPKYFPTEELARRYANNPQAIASRVYADRMGNGPESSGEGWLYRGRGIIQITGKNNYLKIAEAFGLTLEEVPDFLETYDGAVLSACWFWDTNGLNRLADVSDITGMTRRLNGGTNGLADRIARYNRVFEILSRS